MQWIIFNATEMSVSLEGLRRHHFGFYPTLNPEVATAKAAQVLQFLNIYLESHDWLALNRPTLAEIALFPGVALSSDLTLLDLKVRGFFHHRDSQAVPLRKLCTVCPTATNLTKLFVSVVPYVQTFLCSSVQDGGLSNIASQELSLRALRIISYLSAKVNQ